MVELSKILWQNVKKLRDGVRNSGILGTMDPMIDKLVDYTFRPPSHETEATLPLRLKLMIPQSCRVFRDLAAGVYEKELTLLFMRLAKNGMNIVDLGAHVGYYTVLASRLVGPKGKVYAFEPDPFNMDYLLKNIKRNDCSNVIAVRKAVSNRTGLAYFSVDPYHGQSHLSTIASENSVMVQTVRLDSFLKDEEWPRIDLIKADIEGGERAAIEGMREICRRNPEILLIMECNLNALHRFGTTREDLIAVLLSLDFRKGYVIERKMEPFGVAKNFPNRSSTTYNLLLQRQE
ncbi:MAG TPA: FkbM family methyltransferase [Candidatus Bathyarchaeia archaeon]|nr:FkbM family methyltransferase [Candidatus Bathyarchaeia archaeon]